MEKNEMLKVESYFEAFIIITLLSIFIYTLWGFLIPLLLAATFCFLFYKPYLWVKYVFRSKDISALIILILVLLLILGPIYWVSVSLVNETTTIISKNYNIIERLNIYNCEYSICQYVIEKIQTGDFNIEGIFQGVAGFLGSSIKVIFDSVYNFLIDLFVFILAFYFLLRDGDKFMVYIKKIIPMKNSYKEALFVKFKDVTEAVFVDTLLIAMMQGALVGIGFYVMGFSSPVFWSVIATFFALIPMLGAPVVWFPAVLFLVFTGDSVYFPYDKAIFLMAYGAIVVGLSDNIMRPILLKQKIQIHPFIILLSILGGLEVFNFFGIFLGPIIVSILVSVIQLYKLDFV